MPSAEGYDAEIELWPWKGLLHNVSAIIEKSAPLKATILDYMCGTGLVFRELCRRRPDLRLVGCDISEEYITHAATLLPTAEFHVGDAMSWTPSFSPDYVICTAGIHHLKPSLQELFVQKVKSEIAEGGTFIVGEELLPLYGNETQRLEAVSTLYADVFEFLFREKLSREVVAASIEVVINDVCLRGEFKFTGQSILDLLNRYFSVSDFTWNWPGQGKEYGDAILVCRPSNRQG